MKKSLKAIAPLFAAVTLFGIPGFAADDKVSASDREFMTKAAQGGMMEVRLGELAKTKAERSDVKDFGEMMVTDHSKANANLTKIAIEKGVKIPEKLDKEHEKMVDKLSKLSGKQFDEAYVADMVEDHKKDVAAFEKATHELTDAEVKGFASNTLPTLKKHLKKIEQIHSEKK